MLALWLLLVALIIFIALGTAKLSYQRGLVDGEARAEAQLRAQVADKSQAFASAVGQWSQWEAKATGLQHAIAGILNERDQWQNLYTEQTIAHGNAQTYMMGAIGMLQDRLMRATGKSVELPAIAEAQRVFLEEHVQPTLRRTGIPTIHQGPLAPEKKPPAA